MLILCPGPFILMPIYFISTRGAMGLVSSLIAGAFFALLVAISVATCVLGVAIQAATGPAVTGLT